MLGFINRMTYRCSGVGVFLAYSCRRGRRPTHAETERYAIKLKQEEEARLQAMARKYTSPYHDVICARIVLYAAQELKNG